MKITQLFIFLVVLSTIGGQIAYWSWYANSYSTFTGANGFGLALLGILFAGTTPLFGYLTKEIFD
ncbi:MAG: hypothetical protein KUG64_10500 [Cycloclasticus sp.]|nr:hypothetical protein [Cycloclasticus sp.]